MYRYEYHMCADRVILVIYNLHIIIEERYTYVWYVYMRVLYYLLIIFVKFAQKPNFAFNATHAYETITYIHNFILYMLEEHI